ncbi:MAG TPA: AAA family ATPase [Candidatus Omnitrophota bacterium]|nr:AAA family ATPase [Candidatus Omnitrophota bacterium]
MAFKKHRVQLFFIEHGGKVALAVGALVLFLLAYWGLMSLESYYRNITLAQIPINFISVIVNAFVFAWIYMNMFRGGFAGMKKKAVKANQVNIRFDDVVGIDEAKDECREVVDLIKDHTRVKDIGGKILRGVLMIGPPGCGKTYIAKAIATETGLPFLSMAASEFNEVFVGVGASRVRQLFQKARRLAYGYGGCVIFIDELDAMGQKRTFSQFGSGEGNTTQNQLLVELDGLGDATENIVVIGATNASEDVLDPALLRPGRLDRKVYINKPNLEGREAVFNLYLKKIKHDSTIDAKRLARRTIGYSPAEIENAVKESALIATRNKRDVVTWNDMTEALDRIELGFKVKLSVNSKEREMTAYHETGHLIATYLLHPRNDVFKASILPRKNTLGVVYHVPTEEWHSQDKETLLAQIKVAFGGFAGERVKYGTSTSGVSSDFKSAMSIAHTMVWKLGMGESNLVGDFTIVPQGQLSKEVITQLNNDTQKIMNDSLKEVEDLLRKEKTLFERFAQELIAKGELQYDEIEAIFLEFGKANRRKFGKASESDSKYLPPSSKA